MQKNIVFYFTGTGNSYYVAKTIAYKIGATLKPIVSLKTDDSVEADILFFVFPVYDFKPPKKVTEIVESLSHINANYTITICTYGVALSSTLIYFNKLLHKKGAKVSTGYGIKLPHNAVGSAGITIEENNKRILQADNRINEIVLNTQKRFVSKVERTSIFEDMTIFKQFPCIIKLLSILIFKGTKSLEFSVSDECISCYQCLKICPVSNIKWVNGKPVFGKNCSSCFACMQWCPKTAINLGKYSFKELYIKQYHHPKVQAKDLIFSCEE